MSAFTSTVDHMPCDGDVVAKAQQAERLDALLFAYPWLGYHGIDTDNDWPACRYDETWRCCQWLSGIPRTKRPGVSSYWLKHVIEDATNGYIANGSMIAAAALMGIEVKPWGNSPNAAIAISRPGMDAAIRVRSRRATLRDLTVLEPRLKALASAATLYKQKARYASMACANDRWYGHHEWEGNGLRKQLIELVGWEAHNPLLRTSYAYDLAYQRIYAKLPDCRNCACVDARWALREVQP